eukprot:29456-Pelagococcus_subviridis.AAC.4
MTTTRGPRGGGGGRERVRASRRRRGGATAAGGSVVQRAAKVRSHSCASASSSFPRFEVFFRRPRRVVSERGTSTTRAARLAADIAPRELARDFPRTPPRRSRRAIVLATPSRAS